MNMKFIGVATALSLFFSAAAIGQEREIVVQQPPSLPGKYVVPTPASCQMPKYPPEAVRYELEGTVVVNLLIGPSGAVSGSQILRTSGWKILDETTIAGLSACHYAPVIRDGAPVGAHWVKMAYVWQLYDVGEARPSQPSLLPDTCEKSTEFKIAENGQSFDTIYLRFLLSTEGKVYGVKLEQGSGDAPLDRAAIKLVESCRYTPSLRAGKPTLGISTIRYHYTKPSV